MKHAHKRLKKAIANLASITKDKPFLAAEKTLAEAAQLELLARLTDSPETLSPTVLNRIKDSAVNSIARMEQWDKKRGDTPQDALAAITSQMAKLKGKIKLEVSLGEESDPLADAINITPEIQEG